ncbi:MAG: hypothetical protein ACI9XJ_002557 [Marivirga sp.]|jgi:hypothetical protein
MSKENENQNSWKSYFQLGEVAQYFSRLFYKKDPNAPTNTNLKLMHGINKISILLFLIALVIMISRAIMR